MIVLILIVLGLSLGSFVNALVWRIYKQENIKSKKALTKYSISTGRSMCVHCEHVLAPSDLIPVFSWLWLRGKCRYCHKQIPDTPLTEILTPILFVISYMYWPANLTGIQIINFGFWLVFLVSFVAMAIYDLKWFILPNRIIFPMLYLSGILSVIRLIYEINRWHLIFNTTLSVLIGGGIFWLLFQISKGKWIGGGDVKLGFLIGAILAGPYLSFLYIFIASLIGTIFSLPILISGRKNKNAHIPFGPFLLVGAIITYLFGQSLIQWYKRQVGLM